MILQTGQRTDIPAFYPLWLANRIEEGYVMVRNPYQPLSVTKYLINPDVIDGIAFCSKNPRPFFPYLCTRTIQGILAYDNYTLWPRY